MRKKKKEKRRESETKKKKGEMRGENLLASANNFNKIPKVTTFGLIPSHSISLEKKKK